LQVSIADFAGTVEKIFGQGWLSPLEKIIATFAIRSTFTIGLYTVGN